MADNAGPGLAEAIAAVREQLRLAQDQAQDGDVRFAVGDVELEFAVDVTKTGGGQASITVLSLLSIGGKGEVAKGQTNTVKVTLTPIGVDGRPFEIAASGKRRPDGNAAG